MPNINGKVNPLIILAIFGNIYRALDVQPEPN